MAEQRGDTTAGQLQVDVQAEFGIVRRKRAWIALS